MGKYVKKQKENIDMFEKILPILEWRAKTPAVFGAYHIIWIFIMIAATVLLCLLYKKGCIKKPERVVWITAVIVIALEIYKQIVFCYGIDEWGVMHFEYQWFILPWQFCSMPMYIGLLAGILRGKARNVMHCFLATYAIFGGLTVMAYPGQVFVSEIGINIQTMVCHASMIVIGVFLFYTGLVKTEFKSLLKASAVFVVSLGIAVGINEWAYRSGIMEGAQRVNMFYVSPYCEPSLPVYSNVQRVVPYPWNLFIYIAGFCTIACLILYIAKLTQIISAKIKAKKEVA